jgi:hypothetical protein
MQTVPAVRRDEPRTHTWDTGLAGRCAYIRVIQIQLQADPQSLQQSAPIMMLASDYWNTDFCIGQDHSDLVVWLRLPGSNVNRGPPFTIGGVFQPQRWTSVNVMLQHGDLRIVERWTRVGSSGLRDHVTVSAADGESRGTCASRTRTSESLVQVIVTTWPEALQNRQG